MPWEAIAKWALGAWLTVLSWVGVRQVSRIDELEKDRVTRNDFDELRHSLTASITNAQERTEARLDKIWEHLAKGDR